MANFVWNSTTKKMSVTLAQQLADPELAIDITGTFEEMIVGPVVSTPVVTRYQTVADLTYKPVVYFPNNDGTRNLVFGQAKSTPLQYLETKTRGIYNTINLNYTFVDLIPLVYDVSLEPKQFRDTGIRNTLSTQSLQYTYSSVEAPTIAVSQELKIFKIFTPVVFNTIKAATTTITDVTVDVFTPIQQPLTSMKYKTLKGDYQHLNIYSPEYMDKTPDQLYIANSKLTRNPQKDTRGQKGLKIYFDSEFGSYTYYNTDSSSKDRTILNDHEVKPQFFTFNPKKILYFTDYTTNISPTNVNGKLRDIKVVYDWLPLPQKFR